MSLTKMVDGKSVSCTAQEETELLAQWAAWTPPIPIDLSDVNNLEKGLKALALCVAQVGGLTMPQMKILFKQKWDDLP